MENFSCFDKLNIPIYICDADWKIVFRNKSCKKYTRSPRLNGNFSRCFADTKGVSFPVVDGEGKFISCVLGNKYKTALCLEYKGLAIIMMPAVFDFDLLFADVFCEGIGEITKCARDVFDALQADIIDRADKFGTLDKIYKYAMGTIERYITLSIFDTPNRVIGSLAQINGFFLKRLTDTAGKAGYKIKTELTGIERFAQHIYTDTLHYTAVLGGLLLFALGISDDKKCIFKSEYLGNTICNTLSFTIGNEEVSGRSGSGLKGLMDVFPVNYLNFMPYDILSDDLGWRINYCITQESPWNGSIVFEIDDDNVAIFKSAGKETEISQEEIMEGLLKHFLYMFRQ